MTRIFTPWNHGFGDRFATIQLLAHYAVATEEAVVLSDGGRGRLHDEILGVLDLPVPLLRTESDGNTPLDGFNVWATPYFPTRLRWNWNQIHTYAVFQFDGISSPQKNPPHEDQKRIYNALFGDYGLPFYSIGNEQSVETCVKLLAGAAFFVGSDSGMSHLAHSVGTPVFLLEYGLPVVTCHRGKEYIHCAGAGDFLDWKLPTWWRYRTFLGLT